MIKKYQFLNFSVTNNNLSASKSSRSSSIIVIDKEELFWSLSYRWSNFFLLLLIIDEKIHFDHLFNYLLLIRMEPVKNFKSLLKIIVKVSRKYESYESDTNICSLTVFVPLVYRRRTIFLTIFLSGKSFSKNEYTFQWLVLN